MNDPRSLAEVDPAWHAYQYPETGMEEFANAQPSVSTSRRGVKRRKDSSQIEAENARRSQAASGAVAPGHIGSDGFGHGMMIGPGAGVNPEDIHPQVSRVLLDPSHVADLTLSIAYNRFESRLQLDFTAFDHETVSSYLERNHAIPKFGFGSIHSVWDVNAKTTDRESPSEIRKELAPGHPLTLKSCSSATFHRRARAYTDHATWTRDGWD